MSLRAPLLSRSRSVRVRPPRRRARAQMGKLPSRPAGHCCYLLQSQRRITHTYIGYTVNPERRLRQHNGGLTGGARATSAQRPWRHLAIVRGFPSHRAGLSFEWHWKNARRSRTLRVLVRGRTVTGPRGRLWVLEQMLRTPPWSEMPLVVDRPPPSTPSHRHRLPATIAGLRRLLAQLREHGPQHGAEAADLLQRTLNDFDSALPPAQDRMRTQWRATALEHNSRLCPPDYPAPATEPSGR